MFNLFINRFVKVQYRVGKIEMNELYVKFKFSKFIFYKSIYSSVSCIMSRYLHFVLNVEFFKDI